MNPTGTQVRAAILAYMVGSGPSEVPGFQKWYQDMPWWIDGGTWDLAGEFGAQGWGAVGVVHLDSEHDQRTAVNGAVGIAPSGQVMTLYKVTLLIQYQFAIPTEIPAGQDESMWVTPSDTLIDNMKALIRADPTFGTGPAGTGAGTIFLAGQGENDSPTGAGPLIQLTRHEPIFDPNRGVILQWTAIELDVLTVSIA